VRQCAADCPDPTFCADEDPTRVGFVSPDDVRRRVTDVQQRGLVFVEDHKAVDIAVVDQVEGPTSPCDRSEFGRHDDSYVVAWLRGKEPGMVATPEDWQPDASLSRNFLFIRNSAIRSRPRHERRDGDIDILEDPTTGRECSVGRLDRRD
jgi:hypothetical protein